MADRVPALPAAPAGRPRPKKAKKAKKESSSEQPISMGRFATLRAKLRGGESGGDPHEPDGSGRPAKAPGRRRSKSVDAEAFNTGSQQQQQQQQHQHRDSYGTAPSADNSSANAEVSMDPANFVDPGFLAVRSGIFRGVWGRCWSAKWTGQHCCTPESSMMKIESSALLDSPLPRAIALRHVPLATLGVGMRPSSRGYQEFANAQREEIGAARLLIEKSSSLTPHPHVLRVLGWTKAPSSVVPSQDQRASMNDATRGLCLVCEYGVHGTLEALVGSSLGSMSTSISGADSTAPPLTPEFLLDVVLGAIYGLIHLHTAGISHGNLNLQTCVLDFRWAARLTDYGLIFNNGRFVRTEDAVVDLRALSILMLTLFECGVVSRTRPAIDASRTNASAHEMAAQVGIDFDAPWGPTLFSAAQKAAAAFDSEHLLADLHRTPQAIKVCVTICREAAHLAAKANRGSFTSCNLAITAFSRCSELLCAFRSQMPSAIQRSLKEDMGSKQLQAKLAVLEEKLATFEQENKLLESRLRQTAAAASGSIAPSLPDGSGSIDAEIATVGFLQQSADGLEEQKDGVIFPVFARSLSYFTGVDVEDANNLRWLVADVDGVAQRATWQELLQWFSPMFRVGEEWRGKGGKWFTIKDVLKLATMPCFFGFTPPDELGAKLLAERSGSYLLRFSRMPGCYTMTVNHQGSVGHWRITDEVREGVRAMWVDSRSYASLDDIIETHRSEPLRMVTGKKTMQVRLIHPFIRDTPNNAAEDDAPSSPEPESHYAGLDEWISTPENASFRLKPSSTAERAATVKKQESIYDFLL